MRIEVTADDIANGTRRNGSCCPVANAIHRTINPHWHVTRRSVKVDDDCDETVGFLPDDARVFVHNFDLGEPVEPFSFDLIELGVKPS